MRTIAALVAAVALLACGCSDNGASRIRLRGGAPHRAAPAPAPRLRIGAGAFLSPRDNFLFLRDFTRLLGEKTGMKAELVQRQHLAALLDLLRSGGLEAAFIDPGAYVTARDRFPLDLLAVAVAGGRAVCYSYVIVRRAGGVEDFSGLKGKLMAFSDPLSATGYLWPAALSARAGAGPTRFFSGVLYTWGQDNSMLAVAEKQADAAAIGSLVWQRMNRDCPETAARTRIVSVSPPLGPPPVVAPLTVPAALRERLRAILLGLHRNARGRRVLKSMMIDRFAPGDDSMYDSVRRLRKSACATPDNAG